jgi:hypothetical protein
MLNGSYHVRHRNGVTVDFTGDLAAARRTARIEGAELFQLVGDRQYLQALPSLGGNDDGKDEASKAR